MVRLGAVRVRGPLRSREPDQGPRVPIPAVQKAYDLGGQRVFGPSFVDRLLTLAKKTGHQDDAAALAQDLQNRLKTSTIPARMYLAGIRKH